MTYALFMEGTGQGVHERSNVSVLADACVSCPPAVPVVIAGERITPAAAACMAYYGIDECNVVKNA